MIDYNRHIEIEKYLQGELSPEEQHAFEQKMASDIHLKNEVQLQKVANNIIIQNERQNIKKQLQQIHIQNNKGKSYKTLLSILFATLFLSIISILFVSNNQENDQILENNLTETIEQNTDKEPNSIDLNQNQTIQLESSNSVSSSNKEIKLASRNHSDINLPKNDVMLRIQPIDSMQNDSTIVYPDSIIFTNTENKDPIEIDTLKSMNCEDIKKLEPTVKIVSCCFGKGQPVLNVSDEKFVSFSISNTNQTYSTNENVSLNAGNYIITAEDENECVSAPVKLEVKYESCNFSMEPNLFRFMEFSLSSDDVPLIISIRNARTGLEVFTEKIEYSGNYKFEGNNNDGSPLPKGNYVYRFTKPSGEIIAQGQLTIIR